MFGKGKLSNENTPARDKPGQPRVSIINELKKNRQLFIMLIIPVTFIIIFQVKKFYSSLFV